MTNDKIQIITKEIPNSKKFDLEERTLNFAKNCIDLCNLIIKDSVNKGLIVLVIAKGK